MAEEDLSTSWTRRPSEESPSGPVRLYHVRHDPGGRGGREGRTEEVVPDLGVRTPVTVTVGFDGGSRSTKVKVCVVSTSVVLVGVVASATTLLCDSLTLGDQSRRQLVAR